MTTTQAALLDALPRWLALPRSNGAVQLLPVTQPSAGPDVFVKLQDVAAALRAAEAAQPVDPDFEGRVIVGFNRERGYAVYEETAPGEFQVIKGPFPTREEADAAMRAPLQTAEAAQPEPVAPEYGATDYGFTFAGLPLTEGDKRLAALLTQALGNDHPAFDDLVALFFAARATPQPAPIAAQAESAELRHILAVQVAGATLYMDDGELQDSSEQPTIDFKRDTPGAIQRKLTDRGLRRLARPTKAERVHALVNDGPFPGMSEAFDAHMGAACWVDHAYRQDAATWAAAWKAALAAQAGPAQAPLTVEALADKIAELLRGTYHCNRVWEAWSVGTMSEDDFEPVDESETPHEIAEALHAMIGAQAPASTRPADASISGQRVDVASAKVNYFLVQEIADDRRLDYNELAAAIRDYIAAAPQAPAEQPADVFSLMLHSKPRHEDAPGNALLDEPFRVAPAEPAAQAVGQDAALPVHEVWREGYRITGESEGARKLGEAQAATFAEACDIVCCDVGPYDAKTGRVWGCRLFNNEADARKAFG